VRNIFLSLIFSFSSIIAGSISNPMPIENAKTYNYTEDSANEYYTFTLVDDGQVIFRTKLDTLTYFKTFNDDYSYYSSDCSFNILTNNFKSCFFEKGKYIFQVSSYYDGNSGSFSIFSPKMSDYISLESENKIYSEADLNSTITATKKLCRENPTSCGIDTESSNLKLTKDFVDNLPSNWNLIGSSESISSFGIFDNVETLWFYENSEWVNYNPNSSTPPTVSPTNFQGFWLRK